jgi:hypothetical protein
MLSQQLDKTFHNILKGYWKIIRYQNARDFLESIVTQQDRTTCLERLASSKDGQVALHAALTFVNTPQFMNTVVSDLLDFLQDPELKRLCDGELLAQILWVIVEPPLFWNNLLRNFRSGLLDSRTMEGFTWLLLQLIMLPQAQSKDFRATTESLLQADSPLLSSSPKTKQLMKQIKALVAQSCAARADLDFTSGFIPRGRHDNDFVNYRDIAILPTRAELMSTERSFYLAASSVADADATNRAPMHLDNQFRLLRDDMISDMQEEFRNVGGQKQGWHNTFIQNLSFEGFDQNAMSRERPCTLVFQCDDDILSTMLKIQGTNNVKNRKKALKRTPGFLRHQSFGCLVNEDNVLGFAYVDRNEDQLALMPPRLCLRMTGTDSFEQVLPVLQRGPLDFLQLSTPVFAYEPILERLQRKTDIELGADILGLSDSPQLSPLRPQTIINTLRQLPAGASDLQSVLGLPKPVSLDISQVQALIHGLMYQVSLIQGPPGML